MSEIIFNQASHAIDKLIQQASGFRAEHKKVLRDQVLRLLAVLQ